MVKLALLVFLCLPYSLQAKTITKKLHVSSVKKNSDNKNYSVLFKEMAAYYSAEKTIVKCLSHSIKHNVPILIMWDSKNLKILKCKK